MLTGGLRDRMIIESVGNDVVAELTSLGWFDAGRRHSAIIVVDEFPDQQAAVAPNTLAISSEQITADSIEMGSTLSERQIGIFFDFFGENDAVARHIIGDIFDYVYVVMRFPVYDYRVATPTLEFYVTVDDLTVNQREPDTATNQWQRHWRICSFVVEDER